MSASFQSESRPKCSYATSRYLIINADDFGLSDGVCEGIIKAWQDGVVTSTSVLINAEGAAERVRSTHTEHPTLPMGLHLNIVTGRPILPSEQVATLVDAKGQFHSSGAIINHLHRISLSELSAELHAQAELMVDCGVKLSHFDYHFHILALYTRFFPVVRELARTYGVPVRQPTPASLDRRVEFRAGGDVATTMIRSLIAFGIRHPGLAVRLILHMLPSEHNKQAKMLREEGTGTPDWFVDGYIGNPTVDNFIQVLRHLPPGVSEIAVHPAIVDDQLRSVGVYVEQRAEELAVLLDPRVREAVERHGIRLVDFSFIKSTAQ